MTSRLATSFGREYTYVRDSQEVLAILEETGIAEVAEVAEVYIRLLVKRDITGLLEVWGDILDTPYGSFSCDLLWIRKDAQQ